MRDCERGAASTRRRLPHRWGPAGFVSGRGVASRIAPRSGARGGRRDEGCEGGRSHGAKPGARSPPAAHLRERRRPRAAAPRCRLERHVSHTNLHRSESVLRGHARTIRDRGTSRRNEKRRRAKQAGDRVFGVGSSRGAGQALPSNVAAGRRARRRNEKRRRAKQAGDRVFGVGSSRGAGPPLPSNVVVARAGFEPTTFGL